MSKPRADVAGQPFDRLTPRSYLGKGRWLCDCSCGNTAAVHISDLRRSTKSCGCLRREQAAEKGRKSATHGMSKTPEYDVWERMLHRCRNKADPAFHNYGGRGIKVCARWLKFANFIADMGRRPSPKHTIERKKNEGHYTPKNCVWATRKVQARNRRSNRLITYLDRTQCLSDWSDETGLPRQVIWDRLNTGWTVQEALSTPKGKKRCPRL